MQNNISFLFSIYRILHLFDIVNTFIYKLKKKIDNSRQKWYDKHNKENTKQKKEIEQYEISDNRRTQNYAERYCI